MTKSEIKYLRRLVGKGMKRDQAFYIDDRMLKNLLKAKELPRGADREKLRRTVMANRMVEAGVIPPGWNTTGHCKGCMQAGEVSFILPSELEDGVELLKCPWCLSSMGANERI